MPLLDLFNPPISETCHSWTGFHHMWAGAMLERLNLGTLSQDYISLMHPHRASEAFEVIGPEPHAVIGDGFPRSPRFSFPADIAEPSCVDLHVHRECDHRTMAVVTFPGPGHAETPSGRSRFAAKAAAFLQRGVSLIVVNVVTTPLADFHKPLCDILGLSPAAEWSSPTGLSAICYRTVQEAVKPGLAVGNGQVRLDVWPHVLKVGSELPTVPLWLAADLAVPLELELTYAAACKSLRLG